MPATDKQARAGLARIAARWGADLLLIQAPGGNFSAKAGDVMWIKASGARARQVTDHNGLTAVRTEALLREMPAGVGKWPDADEEARYAEAVASSRADKGQRPSMESGFHAALPYRWVVHTHSLAGVLLASLPPERTEAGELLAGVRAAGLAVRHLPALLPGLALSAAIAARCDGLARRRGSLWLLANHGLVWAAGELSLLIETAERLEALARAHFALGGFALPTWVEGDNEGRRVALDFSTWADLVWPDAPLYPDFAVFFPDPATRPRRDGALVRFEVPAEPEAARDARELIFAQAVLATAGARLDAGLPPLPGRVARTVAGLKTERLRRGAVSGAQAGC